MAHPERPTEYESRLALRSAIDALFIELPTKIENPREQWQRFSVTYKDMDGWKTKLSAGRKHPLHRNPDLPSGVYVNTVGIPGKIGQLDWYLVGDDGIQKLDVSARQPDGTYPIVPVEDEWEAAETILRAVNQARTLAQLS